MRKTHRVPPAVRVLVAESSSINSQLLAQAIAKDPCIQVVASTASTSEIAPGVRAHHPDVLLISASLDEQADRGLDVLMELFSHTDVKAVVLLDSSRHDMVVRAFRSGARGVFCRNAPVEALCKCIRVVYEGQIWASTEELGYVLAALVAAPTLRLADATGLSRLSKRERDVVGCLAEGLANREIAQSLGISPNTVKNYMFQIFEKLGVSSRVELLFHVLNRPSSQEPINNTELSTRSENTGRKLGQELMNAGQAPRTERMILCSPRQFRTRSPRQDRDAARDRSAIFTGLGSA
jgi:two-component system nitrate/nitrite response regulator NarL